MENINWGNELRKKISNEEDQTLFDETLGCLKSGFYRAGYIIAWVSIAESLKKKIYDSSNLGDNRADKIYQKILLDESNNQSVDKLIFESAINLKLVDDHDVSKLKFLWEQRCIFAHPYSKAPSKDDLKYIITAAVDICLSKPLLYRKNFIDDLVINLLTRSYFLTDDNESNILFARRIISRIPIELHPYFFKNLLYSLGTIEEDDQKIKIQGKFRMFIIELLKFSSLDLSLLDWAIENRATKFPYTSILGFVHPDIWNKLPIRVKDIIIEYAVQEDNENKQIIIRRIIGLLSKENKLDTSHQKVFIKYLNSIDFILAYNYYGDAKSLYNRVIIEFESGKFVKQNEVVEYLRKKEGVNFICSIDIEKQINIGLKIMISARENSWKSQYFINDLINANIKTTLGVYAGIFKGSLIPSDSYFSINIEYFKKGLNIINTLDDDDIVYIFDYILMIIEDFDAFSVFNKNDIDKISVDEFSIKSLTYTKLVQLIDCLYKNSG